ncbi:Unknown protein sequence [Pseudomonas amygdali pv. lachrymans]|nr:Unknown protein sequence [Pseudomonas amygdali pv. lachrymans]
MNQYDLLTINHFRTTSWHEQSVCADAVDTSGNLVPISYT